MTTTHPRPGAPAGQTPDVTSELDITGMTCASCANRIERKLNKLDGVVATVNYATEKASVAYPEALSPADLVRTVEQAGYGADPAGRTGTPRGRGRRAGRDLRCGAWSLSVPLTLPSAMGCHGAPAPGLPLVRARAHHAHRPVVRLPFHRATLANLRHGATTMDTLVSIGTSRGVPLVLGGRSSAAPATSTSRSPRS